MWLNLSHIYHHIRQIVVSPHPSFQWGNLRRMHQPPTIYENPSTTCMQTLFCFLKDNASKRVHGPPLMILEIREMDV